MASAAPASHRLAGDALQQRANVGMIPADTGMPAELKAIGASGIERWGKIVRIAGVAGYV